MRTSDCGQWVLPQNVGRIVTIQAGRKSKSPDQNAGGGKSSDIVADEPTTTRCDTAGRTEAVQRSRRDVVVAVPATMHSYRWIDWRLRTPLRMDAGRAANNNHWNATAKASIGMPLATSPVQLGPTAAMIATKPSQTHQSR
jgi:hypothetical protein